MAHSHDLTGRAAYPQFLIPQMFAQVAQGKMTAEDAARSMQGQFRTIFAKWKAQGLPVARS